MNYWTSCITDVGTYRKSNQDALLLKTAKTPVGTVLLAAVADGVGGLKCGELASNTMVHDLSEWFEGKLPGILKSGGEMEKIRESLLGVIGNTHTKLRDYMQHKNIQLGTTVALLLLLQDQCLIIHVGDTRVYQYDEYEMYQLTKDHTYVQREIDAGRMTAKEAETSDRGHVLTQCIGSSPHMVPDVKAGEIETPSIFLICSDGFRNSLASEELAGILEQAGSSSRDIFDGILQNTVNLIKQRGERDNISALFVRCFQEN